MMSLRPYMILLIFFLFALLPAHTVVAGQMGGSILYGSGQYRAEVDGEEVQKMTSQYGQVALSFQQKGTLGDARVGRYSLMLGYEFNVLDPTIMDYGVKDPTVERIDAGKFLYQGEFVIAPGGLPFRISAYARDIHQTMFTDEGSRAAILPLGVQPRQSQTSLVTPHVMLDINNGTHHELGVNLLLGIRNGSYLGNYRDTLSQLPRLMIDYRQVEVTDLSQDAHQENYRERDLAFISLNKKDNWVHFRLHEYNDFLDNSQDYNSSQVMIGTVDHILARQWINLTNWIKISGELSYTIVKRQGAEDPENIYDVNFFTVAKSREINASILSNFTRVTEGERIRQEVELPVYFNYEPNRESYYRGSLRGNLSRQSDLQDSSVVSDPWESNRRDVTLDLGSEFFRTQAIIFKPRITLAASNNDGIQGFNEKLILEASNRRSKSPLPWTAGYSIASTQISNDASSSLSVYLEQSLYGSIEKRLSKTLNVGLRSSVNHGSGDNSQDTLGGVTTKVRIGGADGDTGGDNGFWLYNGQVFLEYITERFANRLEFIAEGYESDADNLTNLEVRHELKIDRQRSSFALLSSLLRGSEISVQATNQEYDVNYNADVYDFGWSSQGTYTYDPDRSLRFTLNGRTNSLYGDQGVNTIWSASEKLEYRYFMSNGIIRKLAEISEEFGSEGASKSVDRNRTSYLRLVATVYPTNYLFMKVAGELAFFSPSGSDQMKFNAETGLIFNKLQVGFNYGRGYKEAEGLLAAVREDHWDVKIKKTF